ncbi:MAG: DUF4439 domain-containing protein [Actinomycetota bacterium]
MATAGNATGALQAALAAEHAAVYGYGVAGAYLSGTAMTAATADWVAHQQARDTLETMLRRRGAQPATAAAAYQLPSPVHDAAGAVSLAVLLENRVAAAYLGVVAVSDTALRQFGARGVSAAAARAASWRGRTVAFPGFPAGTVAPARPATPGPATPAADERRAGLPVSRERRGPG